MLPNISNAAERFNSEKNIASFKTHASKKLPVRPLNVARNNTPYQNYAKSIRYFLLPHMSEIPKPPFCI